MAKPKTVETNEKLKASAVHIKDSAAHMERSTARVEDSADRRTELAADRTIFAAEKPNKRHSFRSMKSHDRPEASSC